MDGSELFREVHILKEFGTIKVVVLLKIFGEEDLQFSIYLLKILIQLLIFFYTHRDVGINLKNKSERL